MRPALRPRGQGGSALVEVTWLTILLLVPLVYLVLSVFEVQRAAFGVTAATRAAGRAFVLSPDQATGHSRALHAVIVSLRDQGQAAHPRDLQISCAPDSGNCLQPGSVVVVTLGVSVPLPMLPDVLGAHTPSVRVSSTHRSPYGTFREGRP